MSTTPKLGLILLIEGQANPEFKLNENANEVDALVHLNILDRDLSTPPGSPSNGDTYLVKATGTGDWSGHDGDLAYYFSGWRFFTPTEGVIGWIADENILVAYNGSTWKSFGGGT